jgi:MYXO-CTERM domain-containing protein
LALLRRKRAAATVVLLMMAVAVVLLPSAPVSADLLVSTYGGTSIHRVSADGSTVSEFSSLSDQKTRAMCWGPEGNLFVSIVTTSKVLEFDRTTGDLLGEGRLREVYGMVAGADGALYGSYRSGWNSTHGLRRFDPDEMDESFFAHTEEGASPWGITLGPDDNLYVACRGNSTVIRVDPQTATITDFIPSISQPRNVVFGPDGNLYVTRHDNRSVERYNGQTGEFIDVFVDPQSGGLANPQGLIFPGDGYLYVANAGGVHRYDAVTGNFDSVFCDDPLLEGSKDILFIPEPATMTLLALGGLALLRRRRTSTAASLLLLVGLGMALLPTGSASAVNIETVPVGNPGNAGELSGSGAGGYGPDRICGRVDYEYNIGKYEVTAGQYTEFLNAVAATDTYGLYDMNMDSSYRGCKIQRSGSSGSYTYSVAGDWANRPVNYVSWGDAARFANWLHNGQPTGAQGLSTTEDGAYFLNGATSNSALLAVSREADWTWAITSEDEWYKAAYHKNDGVTGNYFNYPTSSDTAPGYVNNSGNLSTTGNPFVEGGTDPGNYATYDGDGGTNGIGSPYYRTVVGEWENSESPYDTFDQGGNVWEWNEAILSGSYRGRRGGSFYNSDDSLHASSRYYRYGFPTKEDDYLGFRVSEVPEPFTFGLLSLGGLALLRRRKA